MSTQTSPNAEWESITAYLSWDHDRLDSVLTDVIHNVDSDRMEEARNLYRDFDEGLKRHIRIEEQLLFPLFEVRTGLVGGPTAVMRLEHRDIERALDLMRNGLERGSAEDFEYGLRFLRQTLPDHNAREERILYPMTDRLVSERERSVLVERLQREQA